MLTREEVKSEDRAIANCTTAEEHKDGTTRSMGMALGRSGPMHGILPRMRRVARWQDRTRRRLGSNVNGGKEGA